MRIIAIFLFCINSVFGQVLNTEIHVKTTLSYDSIQSLSDNNAAYTGYVYRAIDSNRFYLGNIDGTIKEIYTAQSLDYRWSGRSFLQLNTWRGWSNQYGFVRFHLNQTMGSAASPSLTHQRSGIIVSDSSLVQQIHTNGYHNNIEAMTIEVSISCFSTDSITVTTHWQDKYTYTTNSTAGVSSTFDINKIAPKNSEILIAMRKTLGSASTRYYYHSGYIKYKKL